MNEAGAIASAVIGGLIFLGSLGLAVLCAFTDPNQPGMTFEQMRLMRKQLHITMVFAVIGLVCGGICMNVGLDNLFK